MKAVHISRSDLYEQVWAEPMTKVAERLGVSDVGLAKACARADIPTPARGHWAKVQAGKPSRRPPLPAASDWQPEVVSLVPPPPRPKRSKGPPAIEFEDIASAVERETRGKPILPDLALKDPHPLIRRAMREHQEYRSWVGGGSQQARERAASEPLTKRRWAILSGLFKALEQQRIQVGEPETRNDSTCYPLVVAGEKVDLRFRERVRQARRELTKDERSRSWHHDRTWTQERFPTGELVFSVARYNPSPWEEWSDHPDLPLEDQLREVLIGVYRAAAVERTHRLEREASERRYREEQHQHWLVEEGKKLAALRAAKLVQHANDWQSATAIRSYIQAVLAAKRKDPECDTTGMSEWASWASAFADSLDPITSRKVVEAISPPTVDAGKSPFRQD